MHRCPIEMITGPRAGACMPWPIMPVARPRNLTFFSAFDLFSFTDADQAHTAPLNIAEHYAGRCAELHVQSSESSTQLITRSIVRACVKRCACMPGDSHAEKTAALLVMTAWVSCSMCAGPCPVCSHLLRSAWKVLSGYRLCLQMRSAQGLAPKSLPELL